MRHLETIRNKSMEKKYISLAMFLMFSLFLSGCSDKKKEETEEEKMKNALHMM